MKRGFLNQPKAKKLFDSLSNEEKLRDDAYGGGER